MKYNVGDKVRIVEEKTGRHWSARMDKWLGKTMTIDGVKERGGVYYCMAEDHGECIGQEHDGWRWYEDMISGPADESYELCISCKDGKTTRVVYKENGKVVHTGEAVKNDEDIFDFSEGARLAFEKAFKQDKEVKEVKRPAKVGEYIKVVELSPLEETTAYKTGDIFRVRKTATCGEKDIFVEGLPEWIAYCDYVVLENYVPKAALNKYEVLTDDELKRNACLRGDCTTRASSRKHNCPFWGKATSCRCTSVDRVELITYLLSEDAAKEQPKPAEAIKTEPKFKIGDRVKILFAPAMEAYRKEYIGEICTIKHINPNGTEMPTHYSVGEPYIFFEDELELSNELAESEKKEPNYYSGKVICIDDANCSTCWTLGKVYEFVEGMTQYDDGKKTPQVTSIEYLNNLMAGKFVEFKE